MTKTLTRFKSHHLASSFHPVSTTIKYPDNEAVTVKSTYFSYNFFLNFYNLYLYFITYCYTVFVGDFSSEGEKTFIEYSDERGTIRLDFLTVI